MRLLWVPLSCSQPLLTMGQNYWNQPVIRRDWSHKHVATTTLCKDNVHYCLLIKRMVGASVLQAYSLQMHRIINSPFKIMCFISINPLCGMDLKYIHSQRVVTLMTHTSLSDSEPIILMHVFSFFLYPLQMCIAVLYSISHPQCDQTQSQLV